MTKTYRALATMEFDLYLDIEADSLDEAIGIARNSDGGYFVAEEQGGGWRVTDVYLLDE